MGPLKYLHKDHYAGALMVLVGAATVWFGRPLEVGTLMRMGPGYFPMCLGIILAAIGLVIALGGWTPEEPASVLPQVPGEPIDVLAAAEAAAHKGTDKPEWRGWSCILGSFVVFIILFKYAGIIPATTGLTMVAAFGERGNTLLSAIWLAVFMNIIVVVVFWYALQMPLHLFWWD